MYGVFKIVTEIRLGQEYLVNSQNDNTSTEDYETAKAAMEEVTGRDGIDKVLDAYKIEAIVQMLRQRTVPSRHSRLVLVIQVQQCHWGI